MPKKRLKKRKQTPLTRQIDITKVDFREDSASILQHINYFCEHFRDQLTFPPLNLSSAEDAQEASNQLSELLNVLNEKEQTARALLKVAKSK